MGCCPWSCFGKKDKKNGGAKHGTSRASKGNGPEGARLEQPFLQPEDVDRSNGSSSGPISVPGAPQGRRSTVGIAASVTPPRQGDHVVGGVASSVTPIGSINS